MGPFCSGVALVSLHSNPKTSQRNRQSNHYIFMYVLVVLPLEVAFASFEEDNVSGIICTLVFVADIMLCFRTGNPRLGS